MGIFRECCMDGLGLVGRRKKERNIFAQACLIERESELG